MAIIGTGDLNFHPSLIPIRTFFKIDFTFFAVTTLIDIKSFNL